MAASKQINLPIDYNVILKLARFILREERDMRLDEAYKLTAPKYYQGFPIEVHPKGIRYANKLERQAEVIEKVIKGEVIVLAKYEGEINSKNYVTRIIHEGVKNYLQLSKKYDYDSAHSDDPNDQYWEMKKDLLCTDFGFKDWDELCRSLTILSDYSFSTKHFIE